VDGLAYVPGALAAGQWWRLVGCHLAHWSFDHTLWDALTFLLVGSWCEAAGRRRMLAVTLAAAVAIPPVVLAVQPELLAYAGLSGLDVALCALLLTRVTHERWRDAGAALRATLVGVGVVMTGKLAYEFLAGGLWFVRSYASDFVPVPLAHLVGACIGVAVGMWPSADKHLHAQAPLAVPRMTLPFSPADPAGPGSRCPGRERASGSRIRRRTARSFGGRFRRRPEARGTIRGAR
jgi:rhomboid family GlyGly-CTERM serine protease